jgi:hypothetical protein
MGDSWLFAGHIPKVTDHSQPDVPDPPTAPGFVVALGAGGQLSDPIVQFEKLLTWRVPVSLWGMLRLVATDGSRVFAMHPTSFQVTAYEGAQAVRIIRAPIPHLTEFTEKHFEVTREVWGPIADRMIERDREAGRLGVPPAVSMFFSQDGELWVRRPDDGPLAEDRVWDVFDEAGVWRATLRTPAEFVIQAVRGDQVLGIWTNEMGVSSARVYELVRSE